jgi:hypothetical protein
LAKELTAFENLCEKAVLFNLRSTWVLGAPGNMKKEKKTPQQPQPQHVLFLELVCFIAFLGGENLFYKKIDKNQKKEKYVRGVFGLTLSRNAQKYKMY